MSQDDADPRAEELQLLRQINRTAVRTFRSATIAIMLRLAKKGEVTGWQERRDGHLWTWADITAAGRRTLGEKPYGET